MVKLATRPLSWNQTRRWPNSVGQCELGHFKLVQGRPQANQGSIMRLILALFHLLWTNARAKSIVLNQSHGFSDRHFDDRFYRSSILPNDVIIARSTEQKPRALTSETIGNFTNGIGDVTTPHMVQSSRNIEVNNTAILERKLQPVLFFINRNSGGKVGATLIKALRSLDLHPLQIIDLRRERPSQRLKIFRNCSENIHIMTAGGDGTMNWILDEVSNLNMSVGSFGVIPVGTGNDLFLEVLNNLKMKELRLGVKNEDVQVPMSVRSLISSPKAAVATHMANMLGGHPLSAASGRPPTVSLDRWRVKIRDRAPPKAIMEKDIYDYDYEYDGTGFDGGVDSENDDPAKTSVETTTKAVSPGEKMISKALRRGMSLRRRLRNLLNALAAKINPLRIIGKAARFRNMRMSNYVGFGVDGAVSLVLDNLRNYAPFLFVNSITNKFWYGVCGLFQIVFGIQRDLSKSTTLYCDGQKVYLPPGVRGLVVLNINSYAGGVKLWNPETRPLDSEDLVRVGDNVVQEVTWGSASSDDGMLEVMAVYGVRHLGLIKSGIGKAVPVCQGKELLFQFKNLIPMQVDGEPFMVRPCDVRISFDERIDITTPTQPP